MEEVDMGAPSKGWMKGPFQGALFMGQGAVLGRALIILHLRTALIIIFLTLWAPPHNALSHLVPSG